jgi:hypothetical protein
METTHPLHVRGSSVALWFSILSGPFAWAVDLEARYALVPWACSSGSSWVLAAFSIGAIVLSLIGAFVGWTHVVPAAEPDRVPMRIRFMALGGLSLGLIFALTIIAGAIPHFFLGVCE